MHLELDLYALDKLIRNRTYEIEEIVAGTGYLAKTVIGVGTYLLDHDGDLDLLMPKQLVTYNRFIKPLL